MVTITAPGEISVHEGGLEILAPAEERQEFDVGMKAGLGPAAHEPSPGDWFYWMPSPGVRCYVYHSGLERV